MSTVNKYRIYCQTEDDYIYSWSQVEPTKCPNDKNHTIDLNKVVKIGSKNDNGEFDDLGNLKVRTSELTMFGDLRTVEYTPVIQNYSMYGILNDQLYTTFIAVSGAVHTCDNGLETLIDISDDLYSYAVIRSKKVLKYRPGYSNICRMNAVFDVGTTNSLQFTGLGNNGSDLYFCYTGMDFGVRLSTDGRSEVRELTLSAAEESNSSSATVFLDGTEYTVPLSDSRPKNIFEPPAGVERLAVGRCGTSGRQGRDVILELIQLYNIVTRVVLSLMLLEFF